MVRTVTLMFPTQALVMKYVCGRVFEKFTRSPKGCEVQAENDAHEVMLKRTCAKWNWHRPLVAMLASSKAFPLALEICQTEV